MNEALTLGRDLAKKCGDDVQVAIGRSIQIAFTCDLDPPQLMQVILASVTGGFYGALREQQDICQRIMPQHTITPQLLLLIMRRQYEKNTTGEGSPLGELLAGALEDEKKLNQAYK